ncbi:uncharacterized protein LOC143074222 [Mytilus galloprovincialis]|uniref:uncharacterized protein LOC143074222 n=1 Tax=Mytilus galloprovincialis TaxID=29158 RepID=UPI003F7B6F7A
MDAEIRSEIQNEVQAALQTTQTTILDSKTTLLDNRLECFNKNFQSTQKALAESQLAKLDETLSDNYKFKKRGNEEQHKHNSKVLVKLKEANSELNQEHLTKDNIESAKDKITEGMSLIRDRQKLIKLADSSEAGWRVVAEYTAYPLAENSEDEKRMYKAQTRAEAKIKKEKLKRKPASSSTAPYTIPTRTSHIDRPGKCFNCNKTGHWRRECPEVTRNASQSLSGPSDKISTVFLFDIKDSNSRYKYNKNALRQPLCYEMNNQNNEIDISNVNITSPAGRLRTHITKWLSIGTNEYILDVIKNGYKIPFMVIPGKVELENNRSAKDNPQFVLGEINKLLQKKCISEVNYIPHVVNPLTVAGKR